MLVVTTNEIHGWELQRVCGEVYGVSLRVPNDPANPADARAAAVARLLEHTRVKGGNAVVGLRLDSAPTGDGRIEVCAYGTAVVAAPVDDAARQTATSLGYGAPDSGDAEPEAPEAPEAQPAYAQPSYDQPSPDQPAYGQPAYGQQPSYDQPYQPYPQQPYQQPGQPPYYQPGSPPQQPQPGYPAQQPGYPPQPQHYPQGYPGPQ